jgi:hypothetical protein
MGVVILVAPCLTIQAERRGLEYDRSQWWAHVLLSMSYFSHQFTPLLSREGETIRVLDERRLQEEKRWQSLPVKEKAADWVARHQYTVILGGWASSLGIAGAIISRNK